MLEKYLPIERFVLLHINAPAEAEAFRAQISGMIPEGEVYSRDITPLIGAHLGPGTFGYAIVSSREIKAGEEEGSIEVNRYRPEPGG